MTGVTCERNATALLVIDPYNDFISEGGKLWGRIKAAAEANGCGEATVRFAGRRGLVTLGGWSTR